MELHVFAWSFFFLFRFGSQSINILLRHQKHYTLTIITCQQEITFVLNRLLEVRMMESILLYYCKNDHHEHGLIVNARDDQRFVKEIKKKRWEKLIPDTKKIDTK